jgi:ubiquinone/menaquinone biosynthesis C-methylase UbiE
MKSEVALSLIEDGVERIQTKQVWADLGAGNGVFTHALSTLLQDGSTVYAIDTNAGRMESIRVWQQVVLKRIHADFVREPWSTELLNGIMMANSLHFVKEKEAFLQRLAEKLTHDGKLLIVEYEMEKPNAYVPYPVGFNRLAEVIQRSGFGTIKKLKEVPSVYDNRMIYSVEVKL